MKDETQKKEKKKFRLTPWKHSGGIFIAVLIAMLANYYLPKAYRATVKSGEAWLEAFNAEMESDKRDPVFFWLQKQDSRLARAE